VPPVWVFVSEVQSFGFIQDFRNSTGGAAVVRRAAPVGPCRRLRSAERRTRRARRALVRRAARPFRSRKGAQCGARGPRARFSRPRHRRTPLSSISRRAAGVRSSVTDS